MVASQTHLSAGDVAAASLVGQPVAESAAVRSRCAATWGALSQRELNWMLEREEADYFESRAPANEASLSATADADGEPTALVVRNATCKLKAEKMREEDYGQSRAAANEAFSAKRDVNGEPTTLMVRNVACKLTSGQIREHLREMGFDGKYDFFYLPMFRSSGRSNQGYFFLNLKAPEDASVFKRRLQGHSIRGSAKLCTVTVAEWQGLAELRAHFCGRIVAGRANGPVFL